MKDRTLRVMYQVLLLLMQYAPYGHQMKRRFAKAMSDKNIFEKAKDMIGNVTKFQKQSKLKAGYLECDEFKDSNYEKGYFCYNCIYWMDTSGGKCMIVEDEGPDIFGKTSGVIAPHGCCNGYEANYDKIHDTRKDTTSTTTTTTTTTAADSTSTTTTDT
jgi:hypothetical protein